MLRKKEMPRRRQPQIARTQYAGCQNDSVLPLISAWGPWQAHMDAAVLSQIEQERIRASLYQNAQYALNAPPSQTGSARIELVPHRQQSPPLNQRQRAILVGSGVGNISRHGAFSIGSSVHPSWNYWGRLVRAVITRRFKFYRKLLLNFYVFDFFSFHVKQLFIIYVEQQFASITARTPVRGFFDLPIYFRLQDFIIRSFNSRSRAARLIKE